MLGKRLSAENAKKGQKALARRTRRTRRKPIERRREFPICYIAIVFPPCPSCPPGKALISGFGGVTCARACDLAEHRARHETGAAGVVEVKKSADHLACAVEAGDRGEVDVQYLSRF